VFATPRLGAGEAPSGWARAAAAADTAVLYMAGGDADRVREALLEAGLRPGSAVAVASNVSLENADVIAGTLAQLPQLCAAASGPALVLLGDVFAALQAAACRSRAALTASQIA
jgi:siroheme synthase